MRETKQHLSESWIDVLIGEAKISILANLQSVRMIDSSGLGVLVSAHLAIQKAGGAIKLLNASQRHINLLVLSKLTTVFPNFEDEDDGNRKFSAETASRTALRHSRICP